MRDSLIVVCLWVGFAATAAATTDKKETTKKTWNVDASHGTYGDSIPIEVPAFRGITPELALSYDSSSENGEVGVGWSLDGAGAIERASPGKGAPSYDATDVFLLDGKELVACAPDSVSPSCTTGGTHSTRVENYQRIALSGAGVGSRWTVTAKDGVRRVYAPVFTVGGDVHRWGLEQVIDTVGNVVTYAWGADRFGCCWEHLDSVRYNGVTVTFQYEARPDVERAAVGKGSMRTVMGRLKTIDVAVGGDRLRAYKLSYTQSAGTSRSLLSAVQQYGKDAAVDGSGTVTGGTRLPAITMEYQTAEPAFTEGNQDLGLGNLQGAKFFAIDIDGDRRTDMLELYPLLNTMRRRTWISDGENFTATSDDAGMSASARFLPMDVNGDGKTDIVEVYPSWLNWGVRTWISGGSEFHEASDDGAATLYNADSRFFAMDINGDGMSDLLELRRSLVSFRRISWISTGTGFTEGADEAGINYNEDSRFFAMDVSGDGKSDLVELTPGLGGWNRRIWMSNGAGFSAGAADTIDRSDADEFIPMDINGDGKEDLLHVHPFLAVNHRRAWLSTGDAFTLGSDEGGALFSTDNWYVAIDVNGDSKSDLIEIDPNGLGFYRRTILLSVGDRFVAGASDADMGFATDTKLLAADVDGDGLSEMIELYSAFLAKGRRVWSMSGGEHPDLLASITNSLGGTTSVSYTPSSAWDNTNNPPLMQTATTVTTSDGRGGSATTFYEYAGGLHDRREKRFLGFRHQRETLPCIDDESSCPYVETWFRQDHGAASKPERVDRRTGTGQLLRSEVHEYTTNGDTVPWTSLATGKWDYHYIDSGAACPGAECKRTYVGRTHDEYGEITVAVDHGDFDVAGDEVTLTTTVVPNEAAYIVNLPAEAKTFEGVGTAGALLNETLTYYDGAAGWEQAPTAGLSTTTARWLSSPSSFVETRKEYDEWGNVSAEIDALGARSEFTYDPVYHLLRTSTTNALGQVTSTDWDALCGAPRETVDLNGETTMMEHDALCRMTQRTEPGGMFERHAWVNLGDPTRQHELVESPATDGSAAAMWTRSYFDGYRRTWRSVARGPDAATGDIHVDTVHNARGQEAAVTTAYYAVAGQAPAVTHVTKSSYDALDRLTRVTRPDGAFISKRHGLWSVTDTDELGHVRTDRFDADERRVAHEEILDGETRTTTYVYDARGNLRESTDPLGHVIRHETDSLGRQRRLDDPSWGASTYEYDGADRLTAQTDARGQRAELEYDALGRKVRKTSRAGTDSAVSVSWTHDEVRDGHANIGKLTTRTDGAGSETLDHDVAGNVVRTVRTIDGERYTFEHGYDQGRRKLWTTFPDGDTLGTPGAPLTYDGAGRLASIPGYVDAARYDADGKLSRIDSANGTVTIRRHSPERRWLTGISTMAGATTIQDITYIRDAKGLVKKVESPFDGEGWTYEYDELERLIEASSASDSEHDQRLEYDAIGNITYNSRLGEYTYDPSRPHAVTAAGEQRYAYDAAGLMTSGAGKTMTWDGDNRLASVSQTSTAESAESAASGAGKGAHGASGGAAWLLGLVLLLGWRRRRATTDPRTAIGPAWLACALVFSCSDGHGGGLDGDSGGTDGEPDGEVPLMTFTYDADGARIQQVEGEIVRHHLGDGYEVEVDGTTRKYVSLAGSLVASKEGETRAWVHTDHLGSIQAVTDAEGAEVHRKLYRPYGEVLLADGTLAFEPRGYTGQRHDASGLLYLHARYYDPALARFISPDTIISGADTIGLHRYAYAANDPINRTDIDGHSPKDPNADDVKRLPKILRKADAIGTIAWALTSVTPAGPAAQPVSLPDMLMPRTSVASEAHAPAPPVGKLEVPKPPGRSAAPSGPDAGKPIAGGAPPPGGEVKPSRLAPARQAANFGLRVGSKLLGVATAGVAAWDARNGYNEKRNAGGSVPAAVGNAIKGMFVGAIGGEDVLEAVGDAVSNDNFSPVNYGIPAGRFD